jgi:hypothetical protein
LTNIHHAICVIEQSVIYDRWSQETGCPRGRRRSLGTLIFSWSIEGHNNNMKNQLGVVYSLDVSDTNSAVEDGHAPSLITSRRSVRNLSGLDMIKPIHSLQCCQMTYTHSDCLSLQIQARPQLSLTPPDRIGFTVHRPMKETHFV